MLNRILNFMFIFTELDRNSRDEDVVFKFREQKKDDILEA